MCIAAFEKRKASSTQNLRHMMNRCKLDVEDQEATTKLNFAKGANIIKTSVSAVPTAKLILANVTIVQTADTTMTTVALA